MMSVKQARRVYSRARSRERKAWRTMPPVDAPLFAVDAWRQRCKAADEVVRQAARQYTKAWARLMETV